MSRDNLNDIVIFAAVVEARSFVGGGRIAGLTRSAVGKAVARLEQRLGTRLLNRTTRALSLTPEGHEFHRHCLRILDAVDEAEASVARKDATPRGVLRMTVPDAFGRRVVMPIVRQYLKRWPEVQIEISFTDRIADIIEEGFDLAIRIGLTAPDNRLVSRVVAEFSAFLCAAPSYLAAHGTPGTLDDLNSHECLFFSSRHQRQAWHFGRPDGETCRIKGRSRLRLDNGEALRDAALAGLGVALLPDFLVGEDIAAGHLVQLLPDIDAGTAKIVTLYPDRRMLEPRTRHFVDLLVAELSRRRSVTGM